VIPSELLGTHHRLLVLDMEFNGSKWKKRRVGDPRVKWWTLTKENAMLIAERIAERSFLEAGRRCRQNVGGYGKMYSKVS